MNAASSRVHVVLIPGFGGFDALGQLEYYAGVTPLFHRFKSRHQNVVLHYFDNFPTAAVVTRAARLRSYVAKRIARGEFMGGDTVALVGHSTGGLDIRQLLWDLADHPEETIPVDGGQGVSVAVEAGDILRLVNRVVFLSVPQWGTNIADWVCTYALARTVVVADMRAAVAASQVPVVDTIEGWIASAAARVTDTDLLLALRDALSEADGGLGERTPMRTASAQEAASELGLWLRYMATDFAAINDLRAQPAERPTSPAHFTLAKRREEIARWDEYHIETRSYATLGRRPFRFDSGSPAPRWDLLKPWTYPELTKDSVLSVDTDAVYRLCYRACAGGPFMDPPNIESKATCLGSSKRQHIEVWDSDGIVNTASMLWPDGPSTLLVDGDHMDIVGHYRRVCANAQDGRKYRAYDLLKSGTEFEATFEQVWNDVFAYCAGANAATRPAAGRKRKAVGVPASAN